MAWTTSGAIWCSGTRSGQPSARGLTSSYASKHVGAEAAEEAHHGQVVLAVPAVGGGVDQPAAAAGCPRCGCRPTGHRAGGPVARSPPPTASSRAGHRLEVEHRPRRQRRRSPSPGGPAAAGAARGRTRPRSGRGRSAGSGCPWVGASSRPKHGDPARCSRASAAPNAASEPARPSPCSTHSSARRAGWSPPSCPAGSATASTSGTSTSPAARSQARLAASVVNIRAGERRGSWRRRAVRRRARRGTRWRRRPRGSGCWRRPRCRGPPPTRPAVPRPSAGTLGNPGRTAGRPPRPKS